MAMARDGEHAVPCLATRAALNMLGCQHDDGPERMVEKFEHHRPLIEHAAAYKHRHGRWNRPNAVLVEAIDLTDLFGFRLA